MLLCSFNRQIHLNNIGGKMEIFDYLETANFLKFQKDESGNKLTDTQKINKIKTMLQNGTLPNTITITLGLETIIIRDKLEEYLHYKSMSKEYSISAKEPNNYAPEQSIQKKIPTMKTVKETAELTGVPAGRIREMAKKNQIIHVYCGTKLLINLEKFVEFLNTNNNSIKSKSKNNKYGIERIEL